MKKPLTAAEAARQLTRNSPAGVRKVQEEATRMLRDKARSEWWDANGKPTQGKGGAR
jgi:hypothetical protein